MGIYSDAVATALAEFETALDQVGTSCTWYARNSTVPVNTGTGSALSVAAGHKDPNLTGWASEAADTTLYAAGATIKVMRDIPSRSQAEAAGQMIAGQALAYTKVANTVTVGDLIVFGSEYWRCLGARAVSPPAYRELTLERVS